jgi:hypothetical protein
VASYHKAKFERADMARELDVAQGKDFSLCLSVFCFVGVSDRRLGFRWLAAAAARVPQLEADL